MHGKLKQKLHPDVKCLVGGRLADRVPRMPLPWRLRLALALIDGRVGLKNLTVKQACALTKTRPAQLGL